MGIKKENRGILSKSLSNGKGVDRRIMTELDANKKAGRASERCVRFTCTFIALCFSERIGWIPVDPGGRRGRNGGSDAKKFIMNQRLCGQN